MPFWRGKVTVTIYQLCVESPSAEVSGDDGGEDSIANYTQWELPNVSFEGMWESLIYDTSIKERSV